MKLLAKVILLTFLVYLATCYSLLATSQADIPHLINYQGKLTDKDGKPVEGTKSVTFRIYDVESGGSPIWSEDQSVTMAPENKGIFNVLLGSNTDLNIPFDKPYWLEIKVGTEVMSPRQRIASSAYAINVDKVDNFHASSEPSQNKLLALDSNAKFSSKVIDGILAQVKEVSASNTSTNSSSFSVLFSISLTSESGGNLFIVFSGNEIYTDFVYNVGYIAEFCIKVDGAVKTGSRYGFGNIEIYTQQEGEHDHNVSLDGNGDTSSGENVSVEVSGNTDDSGEHNHSADITAKNIYIPVYCEWIGSVGPGSHTITVEWKVRGSTLHVGSVYPAKLYCAEFKK